MMRTLVVIAVLMAVAGPARAYVRALTPKGVPWQWDRPTLTLHVNAGQPGPELSSQALVQAVAGAAAPWSQPQLGCTSVQLGVASHPEAEGPVKRDGVNRVVFRRGQWCPDP